MNERGKQASKYFVEGYNCCQAVVLAFLPELGIDKETALKIASSFGGGMGKLREVCGALTATFIVDGAIEGYTDAKDDIAKAEHYKRIQDLAEKFKTKNDHIICRDLLNLDSSVRDTYVPNERTEEYYKMRPCEKLVYDAAEILDEFIADRKKTEIANRK